MLSQCNFVGRWLVALREISQGTEVCIDYLATEREIFNHFVYSSIIVGISNPIGV